MKLRTRLLSTVAAIGLSAVAAPAFAAACTGSNVGGADTTDVTFAGFASDACVISGANPQSGPNGDISGFSGAFGSDWSLLGKVTSSSGSNTLGGVTFTWGFLQTTGTTGTWTLSASQNVIVEGKRGQWSTGVNEATFVLYVSNADVRSLSRSRMYCSAVARNSKLV